jgi:3-hydroxyisobutyrate dehydrogenase
MRVAFIGLGLMGSRMALNLLKKGFELQVHNRTRSRAESLLRAGAHWADSPREAARGAHVVCTCVSDPAAMQQIAQGERGWLGGLERDATVVDFSTLGPELTRALERDCNGRGASFVESPMTGSKAGAEAGTLVLMCGATPEALAKVKPVLEAVSARQIHIGPVGSASQVKLVGNLLIAHMLQGLSEGAALLSKAGVPLTKLLEVVQSSGYASPYWDFKGKALAAKDFSQHFSIDLMHKDLTLALGQGQALGVPMPSGANIREVYQLARALGLGQEDIVATAKVVDPGLR